MASSFMFPLFNSFSFFSTSSFLSESALDSSFSDEESVSFLAGVFSPSSALSVSGWVAGVVVSGF